MTDKRKLKQQKSNHRKDKPKQQGSARDEFRKRNKDSEGHPNYIYKKVGNNYEYICITHAKRTRGVSNIPMHKNPDPNDKQDAYFRPTPERASKHDFKKNTEKGLTLSDADRLLVEEIKKKPVKDKNKKGNKK